MLNTDTYTAMPREQLSRAALLYLLAAFSGCVLSLAVFLPWWLLPLAGFCLLWRLLVLVGRLSFPSRLVKTVLVFLSGMALFIQYGFSISIDIFVMLLLSGFSLKLLELYHKTDAQLLLYLSFFVLMTVFLFEQTPVYVLLVFAVSTLVLAAMVAVQSAEHELQRRWRQPLRKAGLIFLLALPVMLFMFVVIPRLPPLWSMPLQKQQQAKTGMSDSLSPGDIASLARSADLAFLASFPGGVPAQHELYWYGMVLDQFDGKRWTESCRDCLSQWSKSSVSANNAAGKPYQVILEPHGNKWLYTLNPSYINNVAVWVNHDNIFRYARDISQRQIYDARYLQRETASKTTLQNKKQYLSLPDSGNPEARALAQQWRNENADAKSIFQKALSLYRASFSYTLQPPMLGEQRIDDFLFKTRSGFCEHFASSFVFLMRAAGIPARVVVGYMGGEVHQSDNYVVVRQYDAHAWAEVWLEDVGWSRIDPTAAVAPNRIDLGFRDAFMNDDNFATTTGLAVFRYMPLLNSLRLQLDHFNYLWVRWILGYEGDQQQELLKKLGLLSPWRIALWGASGVLLVFVSLCFYLYWREWWSTHEPPATRRYRQLCHAYASLGVERLAAETPIQYAEKVIAIGLPGADVFLDLSQQYYRWLYLETEEDNSVFFAAALKLFWQLWVYKLQLQWRTKLRSFFQ